MTPRMRVTSTTREPNVPLLRKTMDFIREHRERWNQQAWFFAMDEDAQRERLGHVYTFNPDDLGSCGTVGCFAGWAAQFAGGKSILALPQAAYLRGKVHHRDMHLADLLVPEPEDEEVDLNCWLQEGHPMNGTWYVHSARRAQRVLGLGSYTATVVFGGANTFERLEGQVESLIEVGRLPGEEANV